MKILDLNEKLFEKALIELIESINTISPEDIILKVEEITKQREKKKVG